MPKHLRQSWVPSQDKSQTEATVWDTVWDFSNGASPWLPAKFLSDVCSTIYLGSRPSCFHVVFVKHATRHALLGVPGVHGVHGVLISLVCLLCVFTWNSRFAQVIQHYTNVCASVPKLKSLSFCRAHEA
jgi:hypothetical protein